MFNVFLNSVHNVPKATAIVLSNKDRLSYENTYQVVCAWAKYLVSVGVEQGDKIAVLTQHEDLHPFLHLALDKLNATVVPLDTDIPPAQLALDLKKLNLKKILIDEPLCQRYLIPEHITLYLKTSGIEPENSFKYSSLALPELKRDPSIPNYIVASSGVSADKKWIPIASEGLDYWANIEKNELKLSPKDKILCTRSPAYDARISEYIRSFAAGSALVLMPQAARRDFDAILEQCEQEKITCLILIASQLAVPNIETIIQRFSKAGLIHLMVTGDACTLSLKRLCEQYTINLWNCYGPTEATFGMSILCVNHIEIQDENNQSIVPIGLPHSKDVKFYIIDECLYMASPYLSKGYIGDEEQTNKNFPTMFIENQWIRVFNTENKFTLKNNVLIFKGRINNDAHCKVSGVKVEPYAIQQCLERYNENFPQPVLQLYVVIKPWLNNYKPFAYLVIQNHFDKDDFTQYIKKWLRKEEIPILVVLSEFPRLVPSQKIDRRELIDRIDQPNEFLFHETPPPSLGDKTLLYRIWCETLGIPQCSEEQDFMLLGGDSFRLNQLLGKIQKEINPSLRYQDVLHLNSITVAQLRALLETKEGSGLNEVMVKPLVQPSAKKLNYFFLPPLLGEGYFTYKELVQEFLFNKDFNVYGLSDPGISNSSLKPKTIQEAAKRYVDAIKKIQPAGPYYLLGFSFGGTLAYYVAKELLAQGQQVKELHVLDGFPPAMYQQLPTDAHAELLEELINFIIQTLNNRFYNEKINPIQFSNMNQLNAIDQINLVFNYVEDQVKKPQSKAILALSRQHLLFMLEEKEVIQLPIWANLYLSSPNQTYLNVIHRINKMVNKSPNCQYYYWNNYFSTINLSGERVEVKHLELLKSYNNNFGASAGAFWVKAHDFILNAHFDHFGPTPFFTMEKGNEGHSICHIYSLPLDKLNDFKKIIALWPEVKKSSSFLLYERIGEKYKPKDRIYSSLYCLSFVIPNEKIKNIQNYLKNNKLIHYLPTQTQYHEPENKLPCSHFYINLDIFWNRQFLMSLYFKCHAANKKLLKQIMDEINIDFNLDSAPTKDFYNYRYSMVLLEPSVHQAISQISSWLNQLITLLRPHVEPSFLEESNQAPVNAKQESVDNSFC